MHDAFLAFGLSLSIVLLCGPKCIRLLAAGCRETIRQDSARLASLLASKAATPTMGGLLLLAGFLAPVCLLADLTQPVVVAALVLALGLGCLGACDDLCKRNATRRGLAAGVKLVVQTFVAMLVVLWLSLCQVIDSGLLSSSFAVLLVVGMSNAVNLTDGLDGLAAGCSLFVLAFMAIVAAVAPDGGETGVMVAALAGAVLGFLWFNRHPARVFMGDTGSLPLGGLIGLFVLLSEHKLPLLLSCGVFLMEAASVAVQVGWFKYRGRRLLLCAPLHHHFQFLGWPERRIVGRFWLAGLLCALASVGMAAVHLSELALP